MYIGSESSVDGYWQILVFQRLWSMLRIDIMRFFTRRNESLSILDFRDRQGLSYGVTVFVR